MTHWSETENPEELVEEENNWKVNKKGTKGPLEYECEDGSVIAIVNSGITGNYSVNYEVDDNAKSGVKDELVRYVELGDALEWTANIIRMHNDKNNL